MLPLGHDRGITTEELLQLIVILPNSNNARVFLFTVKSFFNLSTSNTNILEVFVTHIVENP